MRLSIVGVGLALTACGSIGFETTDASSDAPTDVLERLDAMDAADTSSDAARDAPSDAASDASDAFDATSGPTVYISPAGFDSGDGTRALPFRTFSRALSELAPGATLVLMDGTYSVSNGTGQLQVDCGSESTTCDGGPCANGERGMPIQIRAESERLARLEAEPGDPDLMAEIQNCSCYVVEGLTLVGADVEGNPWHSMAIGHSQNVVVRRSLFSRNNRFTNSHLLLVFQSQDVIVEENEFYDFHRTGLSVYQSERVTARRNYANARLFADIPGGRDSGYPSSGNTAFSCAHSHACLFENNISDGNVDKAFDVSTNLELPNDGTGEGDDARILSNLVVAAQFGVYGSSSCGGMPSCRTIDERAILDTAVRNNVFAKTENQGVFFRGVGGLLVDHNTFVESEIRIDSFDSNRPIRPDAPVTNNLVVDADIASITVIDQDSRFVAFNNSFGPAAPLEVGASLDGIGVNTELDPMSGDCVHRMPDGSPMQGSGEDGSDVGATIIRRTVDGTLTGDPLWAPDGSFPCGAVIEGINDAGDRCTNVHTRFNIGTCPVE